MTSGTRHHHLAGLEPDNLLSFMALLGVLVALEAGDAVRPEADRLWPRIGWDMERRPLRPFLQLAFPRTAAEVAEAVAAGLIPLRDAYDFGPHVDLDFTGAEARDVLGQACRSATSRSRYRSDLLAALLSDAAVRAGKDPGALPVEPTPLCLQFGQGHQHFLSRLAYVLADDRGPARARPDRTLLSSAECIAATLFTPWRRGDATPSFRWDPEEDVRYALQAGDPTNDAYKSHTQHGANRLACAGLSALTVVPETRGVRVRLRVLGGSMGREGFTFAWPVWHDPASLNAVRGMLSHPGLWQPAGLAHLGVAFVYATRRISVGQFMNFTRAAVQQLDTTDDPWRMAAAPV